MSLSQFVTSLLILSAVPAFAGVTVKGGDVNINASGSDGSYGGGDGGSAGDVTLNVSYADAQKTQVKLDGVMKFGARSTAISQTIPVDQLKSISISAVGGDGGQGYSGSDGQNGYDGNSGWDGCPPSSGGNGSNGTDGDSGGNGGDGGRGGVIHVTASGDQTEILQLVKAVSSPGSAGAGGSGGRGGRGGSGGRGGRSNCVDSSGNPVPGPDGSNGSDGYSGRDGNDGYSGRFGASGSTSFDVNDNGTVHSYPRPFSLSISAIQTIDQNEDSILEPGEELHITQIQIKNSGPMPTPTGQALNFLIANNKTLTTKKIPTIAVTGVIAGNSVKALTFNKGDVVLQGMDNVKLIGQKAVLSGRLAINLIGSDTSNDSGYVFHWPTGVSAAANSARQYFESAESLSFTLNNLSSKDIGPATSQPAEVEFSWNSSSVPGGDVTVVLKDGRTFTMDKANTFTDFVIPAKSKLPLPLSVTVKNSKKVLTASGSVKVTVRVKDFSSGSQDVVDAAKTALALAIDLRPVAVNHHLNVSGVIICNFPSNGDAIPVRDLDFQKAKGSDRISVRYSKDGLESPHYTLDAFDFAPYTDLLQSNSSSLVNAFLNDMLADASAKGDVFYQFSTCYVER